MHMLPIGVCWEARLGKGRYLIDVLLRDGVVADGVAQMGDVIEVEITKLVFYNRVKFFFLVRMGLISWRIVKQSLDVLPANNSLSSQLYCFYGAIKHIAIECSAA